MTKRFIMVMGTASIVTGAFGLLGNGVADAAPPDCAALSQDPYLTALGGGFDGCPKAGLPAGLGAEVSPKEVCALLANGMSEMAVVYQLSAANSNISTYDIELFVTNAEKSLCPQYIYEPGASAQSQVPSATQPGSAGPVARQVATTVTWSGPACIDVKSAVVGQPTQLVSQQICSPDRSVTRNEGARKSGDFFGVDPIMGSADFLSCQVDVDGAVRVRDQGTAGDGHDINCLQKMS
ncbi:DUF732 domain-containing protein [Mycobacterium hackensackense]|uniref:DUF732 domain-containing protein n=1 Tax=Mycobacterium hackensackense TaxID=228909 RepID=UPI002265F839|nr:DUF732 domain-containing protein [Mycobacterium hackensackense]MCV7251624.1 DUF732 domain-containing protein [Mycobacterium hackensackense]